MYTLRHISFFLARHPNLEAASHKTCADRAAKLPNMVHILLVCFCIWCDIALYHILIISHVMILIIIYYLYNIHCIYIYIFIHCICVYIYIIYIYIHDYKFHNPWTLIQIIYLTDFPRMVIIHCWISIVFFHQPQPSSHSGANAKSR